jgi:hypothetical protein
MENTNTSTFTEEQFEATYKRLKRLITGAPALAEHEKWLLMHDNEALALDPLVVTHPLTKGREVVIDIEKPDLYKPREPFTNTLMVPYYDLKELEDALVNEERGDHRDWNI